MADIGHWISSIGEPVVDVDDLPGGVWRVVFELGGRRRTVDFSFDPSFPLSMPVAHVVGGDVPDLVGVRLDDGFVCWFDEHSVYVDTRDPASVARHAVLRVAEVLSGGSPLISPERRALAEYETYWRHAASGEIVHAGESTGFAVTLRHRESAWFADPSASDGVLVELLPCAPPLPPRAKKMTVGWVREHLLKHTSREARRKLTSLLSGGHKRQFLTVLFRVPRPGDLPIVVGLRLPPPRGEGPVLLRGSDAQPVEALYVHNFAPSQLRRRGGASESLHGKRALIAGVGSVGGEVARLLAQVGYGHLTLVDHDVMEPENTYRHVAGGRIKWIGRRKTDAVKEAIEERLLACEVRSVPTRLQPAITSGEVNLSEFDLVVVCTDDGISAQYANQVVHELRGSTTMLVVWMEPHGLAWHVLATRGGVNGCFECLVRDTGGNLISNRANVAKAGQDFLADAVGCGGRYVEFSALHAAQAATMAVEIAVQPNMRTGLKTHLGDPSAFLAAGFELSERATHLRDGPAEHWVVSADLASDGCSLCRR